MAEHPPGGSSASESRLPTVYITVDLGAPSGDTGAGQQWEPPTAAHLRRLLPGFEVQGLVGRGGMGAVYRGRQTLLDRPVALKVLPPELARIQSGFADRFQTEARMLARLNHDGIVRVFDFGQTDEGHLFMAMEFVQGTTLEAKLEGRRRLPPAEALTITSQVCAALQHAHAQRIIHRDVKPSNVMLDPSGRVKLTDFGLARAVQSENGTHTGSGPIMGTRGFVAPEVMVAGRPVDHRADIYSVGVMLYQMLTGEVPRAVPPPAASERVRDLDPRWDAVVRKAMALDPAQRYQDAAALRAAIEQIGSTPPLEKEASRRSPAPVAGRRARRHQGAAGVPGHRPRRPLFSWVVALSVVAVGALWLWRNWEPPVEDDEAPSPARIVQTAPAAVAVPAPEPPALPTTPAVPALPPVSVPASELAMLTKPAVQSIRLTTEDLGESQKRLQQILDDFSAALKKWQAAHDARLATLRAQYSRAISSAVTSARNARQLADLAALEQEQRILASGSPLPPVEQGWAGERKRLRAIHDEEALKIGREDNATKVELYSRHLGALLAYQTILKQTNRTTAISMVDEVMLEARAEHDRLARGSPGINNAPPRVAMASGRTSSGSLVFEAEDFKPVVSGGDTARESAGAVSLSGGLQLAWFGGKLGDTATFMFKVPGEGRYRIEAVLTKAPAHGIFRFQLNGDFIGEPAYDLHTSGASETITVTLHEGSLPTGNHELKVRVMDTNRSGPRQYGFAMDCLRLVPAP